jgi:predicted metal-dependent hydrolase
MDLIPKISQDWPPAYTLKKSARARHVKLKASIRSGLELVVPLRFNAKHIPEILEANKPWIEKQLAKIHIEHYARQEHTLPDSITFPILNMEYKIEYIKSDNKKLQLLVRPQKELVLLGNTANKDICKKLLLTWVKQQAKLRIPLLLEEISREISLPFEHVIIRNQRTRWGSCTNKKIISLNFKLLFLPAVLVRHILIHELCHTEHMNHSTRFWRLVESFDPDWKSLSRQTRRADKFVPWWALESSLVI